MLTDLRNESIRPQFDVAISGWRSRFTIRIAAFLLLISFSLLLGTDCVAATPDDSLKRESSWVPVTIDQIHERLRADLDEVGIAPGIMDRVSEDFLRLVEAEDLDPLDAYVAAMQTELVAIGELVQIAQRDLVEAAASLDPSAPGYAKLASLPETTRSTARTWLGRGLVRSRLFDEALPVIAEVDATTSIDPASTLFYRGACYHALLMRREALTDLRRLVENSSECPVRFSRTAQLMISDIKPLKEDSLDEISRLMTDVSRRLDLGRADEDVEGREQTIIDKLTKLIEDAEKQQQQQQANSSGSGQGGSGQPTGGLNESQAGGAPIGKGDVDRKKLDEGPAWGNLPPAERHEAIQQMGRDLPTHYREAIEAYFRKLATEG